jgi:hypothetical protein
MSEHNSDEIALRFPNSIVLDAGQVAQCALFAQQHVIALCVSSPPVHIRAAADRAVIDRDELARYFAQELPHGPAVIPPVKGVMRKQAAVESLFRAELRYELLHLHLVQFARQFTEVFLQQKQSRSAAPSPHVDERCLEQMEMERIVMQAQSQAALSRLFADIAPVAPVSQKVNESRAQGQGIARRPKNATESSHARAPRGPK